MNRRIRPHVNPLGITKTFSFEGFSDPGPIVVDVGAFKGEFSFQLSESLPDHRFILFEIRTPIFQALQSQCLDRPHFSVFEGDAARNFEAILRPSVEKGISIDYIFVNFPDPWPKDRHKKRRFIQQSYLCDWAEWLPPETIFVFQTDQPGLFEDTLEIIKETPFSYTERFDASPFGIPTDWEKVKIAEGSEIFRMAFGQKPIPKKIFDL